MLEKDRALVAPIVVMSALSFNLLNGYTVALIDTSLKTNDVENLLQFLSS